MIYVKWNINGLNYSADFPQCKDCKYGSRDPFDMRPIWCIYFDHYMNETDFCSRGKRVE